MPVPPNKGAGGGEGVCNKRVGFAERQGTPFGAAEERALSKATKVLAEGATLVGTRWRDLYCPDRVPGKGVGGGVEEKGRAAQKRPSRRGGWGDPGSCLSRGSGGGSLQELQLPFAKPPAFLLLREI